MKRALAIAFELLAIAVIALTVFAVFHMEHHQHEADIALPRSRNV